MSNDYYSFFAKFYGNEANTITCTNTFTTKKTVTETTIHKPTTTTIVTVKKVLPTTFTTITKTAQLQIINSTQNTTVTKTKAVTKNITDTTSVCPSTTAVTSVFTKLPTVTKTVTKKIPNTLLQQTNKTLSSCNKQLVINSVFKKLQNNSLLKCLNLNNYKNSIANSIVKNNIKTNEKTSTLQRAALISIITVSSTLVIGVIVYIFQLLKSY